MTEFEKQREFIARCKQSVTYFINSCLKVKHPSMGIIPFRTFKYQEGALRQFRTHRFNLFRKCRQCFRGDQMVWGPNGPKRIDSLEIGDPVYTYNPNTGSIEITKVQQVFDNGERELVEVRTKTGHRSITTPDHLYFTMNGNKEAGKLTKDDILLEISEHERYGCEANEAEAYILGYLIGDGHYGKSIHFTNTCFRYLFDFRRRLKERFDINARMKAHSRDDDGTITGWRINICGPEFKNWLKGLGIYGQIKSRKEIPQVVFRWNNKSIGLLINRLFSADGWYAGSHCNELGIGDESIILLNQVKQLLTRFGVYTNLYQGRGLPKLRLYGSTSFKNFYDKIGIFNKTPRVPITKGFFTNRPKGVVKSVKPAGRGRVYDIHVPPYNNYIIDGAVVHNSGISTLAGGYALWLGMFHGNKTILIVSKRDLDAKEFLDRNIKFAYENLPQWMKKVWPTPLWNEHEIGFMNGSKIRSLTASKDTLRSNASSLNIIDEAAFVPGMESMWSSGWSCIQHGGSVLVISTPFGVGGWYYNTYTGAKEKTNDFNLIEVMWWDMDWALEYTDQVTGKKMRIAPTDGIRKCTSKEDLEKWGKYWSPWLEEQYRGLQQRGEAHLFRQEVLAEFLGSGGTILSHGALKRAGDMVSTAGEYKIPNGIIPYIHPITGDEEGLDFHGAESHEGLWIWNEPILPQPATKKGDRIIRPDEPGHQYVMGVDTATGKNNDYSAIEVFDINTMEQVAEYMGRVQPNIYCKMVDFLGRWYNSALTNVERTGIGSDLIDDIVELLYPNLWRKSKQTPNGIQFGPYGFATSEASKPTLNKALCEFITEDEGTGYTIKSERLLKQLQIYIRKRNKHGIDTGKTGAQDGKGNHDDLVIATGLAFLAAPDVVDQDPRALLPTKSNKVGMPDLTAAQNRVEQQKEIITINDPNILMPFNPGNNQNRDLNTEQEVQKFMGQMISTPKDIPLVVFKKHSRY